MHDVAASAGVGIGTVYRHFPSKEVMVGALLAHRFQATAARIGEISSTDGSPFSLLSQALKTGGADVAADPLCQLVTTRAGAGAWEHAEASRLEFEEAFVPLVKDAHRDGSLRADFGAEDVGMLMRAVCATVEDAHPTRWQRFLDIAIDGLRAR